VTGDSRGSTTGLDYATVAYDGATGKRLWARRYDDAFSRVDQAFAVGVSPDGSTTYVTGRSSGADSTAFSGLDYATVAYDAATGSQIWQARYNGPANNLDEPFSLAVSPSTGRVFITGHSMGSTSADDYATIAYSG